MPRPRHGKRSRRTRNGDLFDKQFTGNLSALGNEIGIRFRMLILADGEVELRFRRRRMTKAIWALYSAWSSDMRKGIDLSLRGTAADDTHFESDDLHISSFGRTLRGDGRPHTVKPAMECLRAYLRSAAGPPRDLPVLQWRLKGFECFPRLHATCSLGHLRMAGETRMAEPGPVNGFLTLEATKTPDDIAGWRAKGDALLEHVRRIMSFAASTMLGAPVAEFWHDDQWEAEALSQTTQRSPAMRVIHSLDLQPIFDTAIRSHFTPPHRVNNLPYAIEWFSMSSTYDEVRLVTAMTALENLIDSNLDSGDTMVLTQRAFDMLRRGLRSSIRELLPEATTPSHGAIVQEFNEKLIDLNRRPLRQKLIRLAEKWDASMGGISEGDIKGAIAARNLVVHRGHHVHKPNDVDLWRHVTVVREIVVRFIFAAIGYRGRYISHLGGYHFAQYPPETESNAQGSAAQKRADE